MRISAVIYEASQVEYEHFQFVNISADEFFSHQDCALTKGDNNPFLIVEKKNSSGMSHDFVLVKNYHSCPSSSLIVIYKLSSQELLTVCLCIFFNRPIRSCTRNCSQRRQICWFFYLYANFFVYFSDYTV